MTNPFFNATGVPTTRAPGYSAVIRAEFAAVSLGFDKFPTLSGNASKALVVNGAGTAVTVTTGTLTLAGNFSTAAAFTMSGAYAFTGTLTGVTTVTYPTTGTLATLAGTESLSNKTLVGVILGTPASGTLTNCTGFPASGLAGLGTGVATFLATPSSANLRAALTDETGTGAAYFQGGDLGTPSAGVGTNLTGIPEAGLTLADNTTNDSSTSKHGFLKKLDNNSAHFMDGQGNWTTPPAGSFSQIASTAASGTSVVFTGLTSEHIIVYVSGVSISSGTAQLKVEISTNGGSSYVSNSIDIGAATTLSTSAKYANALIIGAKAGVGQVFYDNTGTGLTASGPPAIRIGLATISAMFTLGDSIDAIRVSTDVSTFAGGNFVLYGAG